MKLEKAIEIKETELEGTVEHSEKELTRADQLSIEAMKRELEGRGTSYKPTWYPLPGETED